MRMNHRMTVVERDLAIPPKRPPGRYGTSPLTNPIDARFQTPCSLGRSGILTGSQRGKENVTTHLTRAAPNNLGDGPSGAVSRGVRAGADSRVGPCAP